MLFAFDTYYFNDQAKTVCIGFHQWTDGEPLDVWAETVQGIPQYESGNFYKRELPCIMSLLNKVGLEGVEVIIIDGYVYLDDDNKPGLGARLYESLGGKVPVIGVAKTNFASIDINKRPVFRGNSARPLFVTAIGIDPDQAAEWIKSMDGEFRIPTLLKKLDTLTKEPA